MKKILGIRKEDKNQWEKRAPLTPVAVKLLKEQYGIDTIVQPFPKRVFDDDEYKGAGADLSDDLFQCSVIVGVKEVPADLLLDNKVYIFFSHTIKGQDYNMPLLKKVMDSGCSLIDYECIKDEKGRRLVFFGKQAGQAGLIDALHGFGRRLEAEGIENSFSLIKQAYSYRGLEEAKDDLYKLADDINENGLPKEISPMVVGITGYGNVAQGFQDLLDILPVTEITPNQLLTKELEQNQIYKVVFKESDIVKPSDGGSFDLNDYYTNPQNYKPVFEKYLPKLTMLTNASYWDTVYPRLFTKKYLKENKDNLSVKFVADLSCDINGGIEFTEKATTPDSPVFVYNPGTDKITDGYEGEGVAVLAVDNLPAEIPLDSSVWFSKSLYPFIPKLFDADFSVPFTELELTDELKNAIIVYNGELTPTFKYLEEYVELSK